MSKKIECPLCKSQMLNKKIGDTSLWSCSECPFVGLEFYTSNDFRRLHEYYNEQELELLIK